VGGSETRSAGLMLKKLPFRIPNPISLKSTLFILDVLCFEVRLASFGILGIVCVSNNTMEPGIDPIRI